MATVTKLLFAITVGVCISVMSAQTAHATRQDECETQRMSAALDAMWETIRGYDKDENGEYPAEAYDKFAEQLLLSREQIALAEKNLRKTTEDGETKEAVLKSRIVMASCSRNLANGILS